MIQGINENVSYKGRIFHIQTEDKGKDNPVLVSILFYKGRILSAERVSYHDMLELDRLEDMVDRLKTEIHKRMIDNLKGGLYDEKIKTCLALEETPAEAVPSRADLNPLESILKECLLPSLKKDLKIELSEDDLFSIKEKIPSIDGSSEKERFLALCSEVYSRVKDRCDKETFKRLVKLWSSETGFHAVTTKRETPSREQTSLRNTFEKITLSDISAIMGETLSRALLEKVLRDIHDSVLQRRDGFDIVCARILQSGIIRKRTDHEWRERIRAVWSEKFRNMHDSSEGTSTNNATDTV